MTTTVSLDVKDQDLLGTLRTFLGKVLQQEDISAVLAPCLLPTKTMVMPTLMTDPSQLEAVDPLSPAFPMNSAKVASRLTRRASGGKIVAVMRPCEIRAFTELVKLKQGRYDELILIGLDCVGAMGNREFIRWSDAQGDDATMTFMDRMLAGESAGQNGIEVAQACRACEFPVPEGADISIGLLGLDARRQLLVQSSTEKGLQLLKLLGLAGADVPPSRKKAIDQLIAERSAFRDDMFAKVADQTDSLEHLGNYFTSCVNCYNCRVACPVCYCRECVFVTDVFDHEPNQYLRWAKQKGAIKMPTDTLLYHITRLTHMSTACVGCGQCSNACPNDIPVMELFRLIAHRTQQAFDYQAGRSPEEKPPLSEFKEDEFTDIVGIHQSSGP